MVAGEPDDKELITASLAGSQQAYEQLVQRYARYVMTLTLRYVRHREQAEELAQDVFVKAHRSLPGFSGQCRFGTWLYTIARSVCFSHLKKKTLLTTDNTTRVADESDPSAEAVFGNHDRRMRQKAINDAIGRLPQDEQQVVTLYYQAEQSVQEIAGITGWTTANVKVKLFRARQKLRSLLQHTYKELQS